ncbi:MAG: kelch repeat-containing protein [Ginsengibacter sp.]
MIRSIALLISIFTLMTFYSSAQKPSLTIYWKKIAAVPSFNENQKSLGLAGAINGVNNDVLIVAGGSNFPDKLPWEGGKKVYYDNIFVLEKKGNQYGWHKKVKSILPEPIAYCGITSTPSGIVYAGGENENGISNKCFLLKWNAKENSVDVKPLPELPLALTNVTVTNADEVVYAVGGDEQKNSSSSFFCLNLKDKNPDWKKLPNLPIALANATAMVQNTKSGEKIFVIGGRSKTSSGISDLHNTVFAFDIQKNEWKKCADISDGFHTTNLSAAGGVALGNDEILITGFDNGKTFHQIEMLIAKISETKSSEEKQKLTEEKNNLSIHHKGFDRSLLLYNTNTDAWTKIGELPFPAHVTTTDVKWGNNIIVSNGEIKPGVRTPDVWVGKVFRHKDTKGTEVTKD